MRLPKIVFAIALVTVGTSCSEPLNESASPEQTKLVAPHEPGYLDWKLGNYGLSPLKEEGAIRFFWDRSFHSTIVFDLRKKGEKKLNYIARVWDERRWKIFSRKTLNVEDNNLVSILELELYGFFDAPHFNTDDYKWADGADWLFEAYSRGKHNWILKRVPEPKSHEWEWGMKFIEESIDSPVVPIY